VNIAALSPTLTICLDTPVELGFYLVGICLLLVLVYLFVCSLSTAN
jgi:hypothetical protein